MKNVRKLSATVILTLIFTCSAFAGQISSGKATTAAAGQISSGIATTSAAGDISSGKATAATFGDISSGLTQLLAYLGIVLR